MILPSLKKAALAFLLATAGCSSTPSPSRLCSHFSGQREDVCEQYSMVEVVNRDCKISEIAVDKVYTGASMPDSNEYWNPHYDLEHRPNPNYATIPPGYPEAFTFSVGGRCTNDIDSGTIDLKLLPSERDRKELWKDYVTEWNSRAEKENALLDRDFLPPELASLNAECNLRLAYAGVSTRGDVKRIRLGRDVKYDIQREAGSPIVTLRGLVNYCISATWDNSMYGCDNREGMLKFVIE